MTSFPVCGTSGCVTLLVQHSYRNAGRCAPCLASAGSHAGAGVLVPPPVPVVSGAPVTAADAAEAWLHAEWRRMAKGTLDERFEVARSPGLPLDVLRLLARDRSAQVRELVARVRPGDEVVLSRLARDRSLDVRMEVALNPSTPQEVLVGLYAELPDLVRMNESVPLHLLAYDRSEDEDFPGGSPHVPVETLEEIVVHLEAEDIGLGHRVWANPLLTSEQLDRVVIVLLERRFHPARLHGVAASPAMTPEIADRLREYFAGEQVTRFRDAAHAALAGNEHLPGPYLAGLVAGAAPAVKERLALNPSTPPSALAGMYEEPSGMYWSKELVFTNPSCPPRLQRSAVESGANGAYRLASNTSLDKEAALLLVADRPTSDVLYSLAANPSSDLEVLHAVGSKHGSFHAVLALNENADASLLHYVPVLPRQSRGDRVRLVSRYCETAAQAEIALALWDGFEGRLDELFDLARVAS